MHYSHIATFSNCLLPSRILWYSGWVGIYFKLWYRPQLIPFIGVVSGLVPELDALVYAGTIVGNFIGIKSWCSWCNGWI